MKLINSVLALLNLSGHYKSVLEAAVLYAASSEAELELYYNSRSGASGNKRDKIITMLDAEIQIICDHWSIEMSSYNFHLAHEEMATGEVYLNLIDGAELIILGSGNTVNEKSEKELLFKIIDSSNVPVMIIPEKGVVTKPSNILYCTSYQDLASDNPLKILKYIAQVFEAEVRVAHVKTHSGSPKEEHIDQSRFEGKFFEPEVAYEYKLIRSDDVIEGIKHYIRKKGDNDLVAMIRRKHHIIDRIFGPNFTRKMLLSTDLPLLILKEESIN